MFDNAFGDDVGFDVLSLTRRKALQVGFVYGQSIGMDRSLWDETIGKRDKEDAANERGNA